MPADESLPVLRQVVQRCQGCGLYAYATQAVFGKGQRDAELMLVGEQAGDREDVAGEPFVVHPSSILRAADDATSSGSR
jgi:DNA polymerase